MVYIYQFLIYGLFTSFPLVHLQRFVENCKYHSTFYNIQECVKDFSLDHLGKWEATVSVFIKWQTYVNDAVIITAQIFKDVYCYTCSHSLKCVSFYGY